MFSTDDTVVAVATPPGRGGIGVVRISGPHTRQVARAIVDGGADLAARHATFTHVRNAAAIDQVVATFFPAPNSYTGEDVLEISAHGSPVVLQQIVGASIAAGARLAEPGEFTLRAFLNGRIDLVQAEAVADLVDAVTPTQARAAFDQLEGTLTGAIAPIDSALFELCARLEASIDFPDEGYHFIGPDEIDRSLINVAARLEALIADGRRGRLIREGRKVVITGKPNVGKSTLFNRLLGADRAIVTPIPGTTRDLVTETTDIDGLRLSLVDTAGIRSSEDIVEREGVTRAMGAAVVADLVVLMLDRSKPLEPEDFDLLEKTRTLPRLILANKCDLPSAWDEERVREEACVEVSVGRQDVSEVRRAIVDCLCGGEGTSTERDVPWVTNLRHLALLERAHASVRRARTALLEAGDQLSEEFLLADLQDARNALEEVTGKRTSEDMLREIFSRFCIGK